MRTLQKEANGIDCRDGVVINCRWRRSRSRDVPLRAAPSLEKGHVALACHMSEVQEDTWYGGSIELERGMSLEGEVVLALEV